LKEMSSRKDIQTGIDRRRRHVFHVVAMASIFAPLTGELVSYIASQNSASVLPSSLLISLSGALMYLWYRISGKLDATIKINAVLQILCFSWGAMVAGGTSSEQFFYLSLFPVLNGFFLGQRAALITTIYTIFFAILLGILEYQGLIVSQQPPILAVTFQTIACLFVIGWLTMTYETERSRREAELTQLLELNEILNRYYDITLEGAGLGSWDWLLETNKIHFDRRWCEMLGLNHKTVEHDLSTWDSRVHPDDKAACYADIRAYLDGKTQIYENIHRLQHSNGTWVWVLDRGRISARDRDGRPVRFTGIHFDITSFKKAERLSLELQQVANIGGWEIDSDAKTLHWTDQTYRIHALPPQKSMTIKHAMSFLKNGHRQRMADLVRKGLEGDSFRDTFEMTDANGVQKWVDIVGVPTLGFDGKIHGLRGTIQDISDKKRAEGQLRKHEIELRETMNAIEQSAIVTTTDKSGKIRTVNDEFCRISGYTSMDVIGCHYTIIIADFENEIFYQNIWTAINTGKTWTGEMLFRTKFGRILIMRSVVAPVHNQQGQIDRAISIHFDISEQKRLQNQLEEAQRVAKIGNWSFDLKTHGLEWSKQMFELFPVDRRDGPPTLEQHRRMIHPEDRDRWEAAVKNPAQDGKPLNIRFRSAFPDRAVWLEIISQAVTDRDGRIIAVAGTCQDISDKVENEKLLEQQRLKTIHAAKLASLGEMSAGVAHEINNPLAIIKGTLPLLSESRSDPREFDGKMEMLERAVTRISRIVNGLRRFSRAADGTILKSYPLAQIVTDATVITELKAKSSDVSVVVRIDSQAAILCDPIEIEQVVINLINNGIDAAKGRPERWVQVHVFEYEKDVVLHVMDSGVGISTEVEEKLFQPFFTTKPIGEGTGLGLSICKGILDQHKATINLNRGYASTCFEVRFNRYISDNRAA
jgi:PAS domain S-box-containing protein